ncbi:MAG TPA: hypothetical protein VK824_11020 [Planctomycetota bacterium]|nr:hypothetical protein [Planctomycetota bacterium]
MRAALLTGLLLLTACAVADKRNRLTLNAMDEHLAPESAAGRWAAAPVAFPAALLGLAMDALVVHPASVLDDAWRDTQDWLWTPRPSESRFRRAVLLPLVVLATPLVYAGDWLRHALFRVDPHPAAPEPPPVAAEPQPVPPDHAAADGGSP